MTLVEIMLGAGVILVLMGMTIPLLRTEGEQVQAAARYLVGRAALARSRAVMSGAFVGMRFQRDAHGYTIRSYVDGDGDGISTSDISSGVDRPLEPPWRLRDKYPSVVLGLDTGVPVVGGARSGPGGNPVRFGSSGIVSFSPLGTASSGTLYVKGAHSPEQYAVRVLGATGRVRVLRFHPVTRRWSDQ